MEGYEAAYRFIRMFHSALLRTGQKDRLERTLQIEINLHRVLFGKGGPKHTN